MFFFFFFRNLLGEDLGPLSSRELEQLERQLDASLKQIRSTRVISLSINFLFLQVLGHPTISTVMLIKYIAQHIKFLINVGIVVAGSNH